MIGAYDNTTSPAVAGADIWDTIDDYNNNGVFPTTAPSGWDQAPGANWIMDPANDTVTVNGVCNGGEACVFIDRTTGLMWARDNGTMYTWQNAVNQCNGSSYGGYTDWRIPTQKELMQAYADGIWTQKAANRLNLSTNYQWSSTTGSELTTLAWNMTPQTGVTTMNDKTNSLRVLCVR